MANEAVVQLIKNRRLLVGGFVEGKTVQCNTVIVDASFNDDNGKSRHHHHSNSDKKNVMMKIMMMLMLIMLMITITAIIIRVTKATTQIL